MISAHECAKLAKRAYAESTWATPGDVEALWVELPNVVVLAVRGSEFDFEDWLRNFRAYPCADWQLGMVHRGYLAGARALWPLVSPKLLDSNDQRPRVIVGHSAGGGIGTVLAGLMCVAERAPALLCTFGCPRVGYAKLGAVLREHKVTQWRYMHGIDCVPDHPWPIWGYRHTDKAIKRSDGLTKNDRVLDHLMDNYVRVTAKDSGHLL